MVGTLANPDPRHYPYVAHVLTNFPFGPTVGSATLIGPRVLLTAGHVVYDHRHGGEAESFEVTIGGVSRRTWQAEEWRTTKKWRDIDCHKCDRGRALSGADVGVIILENPIDTIVPPLTVETTPRGLLRAMRLNVGGYLAQTPPDPNDFYRTSFVPRAVSKHRVFYPVGTLDGMSGGPVWQYDAGIRTVRAIHTSRVDNYGNALRVTPAVYNLVQQWLREFHPSTTSHISAAA